MILVKCMVPLGALDHFPINLSTHSNSSEMHNTNQTSSGSHIWIQNELSWSGKTLVGHQKRHFAGQRRWTQVLPLLQSVLCEQVPTPMPHRFTLSNAPVPISRNNNPRLNVAEQIRGCVGWVILWLRTEIVYFTLKNLFGGAGFLICQGAGCMWFWQIVQRAIPDRVDKNDLHDHARPRRDFKRQVQRVQPRDANHGVVRLVQNRRVEAEEFAAGEDVAAVKRGVLQAPGDDEHWLLLRLLLLRLLLLQRSLAWRLIGHGQLLMVCVVMTDVRLLSRLINTVQQLALIHWHGIDDGWRRVCCGWWDADQTRTTTIDCTRITIDNPYNVRLLMGACLTWLTWPC